MKIAIITLPLYSNYGGILQNFALQQILKKQGYDVETLNIEWSDVSLLYRIKASVYSIIKAILGRNKWGSIVLPGNTPKMRMIKTMSYLTNNIEPNIVLSKPLYTENSIRKYIKRANFDVFIVGSDQVWRPKYLPNVKWYFLGGLSESKLVKRIAYAASFGTNEWEYTQKQTEIVKSLIKEFNAVSVREKEGEVLCKKYLNVNAITVLDPTMLLSADEYIYQILNAKEKTYTMKDCIFSYILDYTEKKHSLIENISEILSSPVERIAYNDKKYMRIVNQWLRGFSECKCVVTDSFHGTVFSILFHRPFVVLINKERGESRLRTLLQTFKLEDRIINNEKINDIEWLLNSIDWNNVDSILQSKRNESLNFLKEALEN